MSGRVRERKEGKREIEKKMREREKKKKWMRWRGETHERKVEGNGEWGEERKRERIEVKEK